MKFKLVNKFSFLNILSYLLITNLIFNIIFPIHIMVLYFFKIPLSNVVFISKDYFYIVPFFIPTVFSYLLTVFSIPFCIIASIIEKVLIKNNIISNWIKIEYTGRKKKILYIVLILAIIAYLISLGGWIHTLIPYTPEELERLRYD